MVSVVVPTFGRPKQLIRCLLSLQAAAKESSQAVEVVVVASGYDSDQLATISRLVTRMVTSEDRMLVSEARNRGVACSLGEYTLFVDDDNELAADSIDQLVHCLDKYPDIAMAGPLTLYGDDRTRIWCAGVWRSRILGRTHFRVELPIPVPERLLSDDFPNCFIVRTADFAAVGGFDEALFPMHYEEADLAARLREAGFGGAACATGARAWHFTRSGVVGRMHLYDPERSYLNGRARALFTARHGDELAWGGYVLVGQFAFTTAYLLLACVTMRSGWVQIAMSYVRGVIDGLRIGMRLRSSRHPHRAA